MAWSKGQWMPLGEILRWAVGKALGDYRGAVLTKNGKRLRSMPTYIVRIFAESFIRLSEKP
jgi:hypothetical protein